MEAEQLVKPPNSPSPPPPPPPKPHESNILSLLTRPLQWMRHLSSDLSPSLVAAIFVVYGLSHGFASHYLRVVSDYYWKDVQKARPASAQFYSGLSYVPWIMRPIWGLLTDVLPVMGYRRRPYLVGAGVIGAVSSAVLAGAWKLPAAGAVVCMVGIAAGMAIANVTIDACVAKNSIEERELAADLQSLCQFCLSVGALLGYSASGFLVHRLGAQLALGVLAIPAALILVLGLVMYELRVTSTTATQCSEKKVSDKAGRAMQSLYTTIQYPQVWKPSLFMFLSLALSFSTQEGYFYWYTNPQAGPGFSQEFVGMIYAIGAVGAIVGVLIYQRFLKDFPFRSILLYIQLLYGISGMLDLVFVLRWNLRVGIPDSFFVIMEESVVHIISKVRWMPMIVLSTRLCPLGIEGTFFALLLCIDTLGWFSAKMIGGVVLHLLHISRTDFTNLWLAVLIRNCLRIGTLALIFLVPNATQYDVLVPPHPSTKSDHEMISEGEELALQLVPLNEKVQI